MSLLSDYASRTPLLFAPQSPSDKPIIALHPSSSKYWTLDHNFALYLASKDKNHRDLLTAWRTMWVSPDGSRRKGTIDKVSTHPISNCKCKLSPTCPYTSAVELCVEVTDMSLSAGAPSLKKANLCMWHSNRRAYDFSIFMVIDHLGDHTEQEVLLSLDFMKHSASKYLSGGFMPSKPKSSVLTDEKRDIYERNKMAATCVACGKPTEERALFVSTIRYCPCID